MTKSKAQFDFRGKILAYSPKSDRPVVYQVEHFLDLVELRKILNHVDDLELELTLHGLEFLDKYYGFEKLAKKLSKEGGIAEYLTHEDQILTWLLVKQSYFRIKFNR